MHKIILKEVATKEILEGFFSLSISFRRIIFILEVFLDLVSSSPNYNSFLSSTHKMT